MAELNPQINTRLQILGRSPALVMMMICATDLAASEVRDVLISEALNAEKDPAFHQALTIVQMKTVLPISERVFSGHPNVYSSGTGNWQQGSQADRLNERLYRKKAFVWVALANLRCLIGSVGSVYRHGFNGFPGGRAVKADLSIEPEKTL